MATLVVAGEVDIDVDVEDYGSTQNEERVVPSGMMMEYPSNSPPSWKTKKAGAVLLGLLVGASLVFPSLVTFSEPARTAEAFLLQARGGANDDTCVPASGPWPAGAVSLENNDEGKNGHSGPFVTCFQDQGNDDRAYYADGCWSHSYYADGYWKACTPEGYGAQGWSYDSPGHDDTLSCWWCESNEGVFNPEPVATCGTPCTTFSSNVPH